MDNITLQADEIEALCSIYGPDWKIEDEACRSYNIKISEGEFEVTAFIKLSLDYPSQIPPELQLLAPCLNGTQKQQLSLTLDDLYLKNVGEPILYQWIEKIREFLQTISKSEKKPVSINLETENEANTSKIAEKWAMPVIQHGNIIQDRKSVFQGHISEVHSLNDIKTTLDYLMENRKVAEATHNILAYRIQTEQGNLLQDFNDDGELQAGRRLLNLLQLSKVTNVMVVVSRWYGGIHLGADRFRHINNAAREILEEAGYIQKHK